MRALLLAAVVAVAAPAAADDASWRFACDGTDPFLLHELDEAMRSGVGYGETWDETVCNQGNLVLGEGVRPRRPKPVIAPPADPAAPVAAPGAAAVAAPAGLTTDVTAVAPAPEKPKLTPLQQKMQDQYFAIFIPVFGMLMAGFCVIVASIAIFVLRRRKQIVVGVGCPTCKTAIPFVVGESPHIFCPACGSACRVDVDVRGDEAFAAAVPL